MEPRGRPFSRPVLHRSRVMKGFSKGSGGDRRPWSRVSEAGRQFHETPWLPRTRACSVKTNGRKSACARRRPSSMSKKNSARLGLPVATTDSNGSDE